ncbi:hypothetical protein EG68_01640 [Paragonimus skrjabini miyazakii]|uniref:RRM domain-containing protein n=1 Tax=Paragonimus skrjabini miyazakii TaxID=59628 RepID=A0A8S9Z508_9TREM|nr:hypothetical protein EG68_01640 [Paragonimus skrjabini miyazakii]
MSNHAAMIGVSNITNRTDPNSLKSRVFVGNLNTVHMMKPELESIFSKYGAIIGISVHKGYAFIQYANETSARSAVVGEDCKVYYNMALDVTVASEPKNRKRGRSNINSQLTTWNNLASPSLTDLAIQAQTLSSLASNPVISSLQQLGLEGIMGQPNFAQFAAAASSVLSSPTPFANLGLGATPTPVNTSRSKHTRLSSVQSTPQSASTTHSSSSAKRTRLDGINSNASQSGHHTLNQLPAGARGQNLVSLVSPSDSGSGCHSGPKGSQSRQLTSPSGVGSSTDHQRNHNRPATTVGSAQVRSFTTPASARQCKVENSVDMRETTNLTSKRSVDITRNPSSGTGITALEGTSTSVSVRPSAEDILICGSCRRLFDQVDELISHKMAGCSLSHATCQSCRCRSGEPENLECAYCGAGFHSAWKLMHHCHNDHGLTIYTLPSPTQSPSTVQTHSTILPSGNKLTGTKIESGVSTSEGQKDTGELEKHSVVENGNQCSLVHKAPAQPQLASPATSFPDGQNISDWETDAYEDGDKESRSATEAHTITGSGMTSRSGSTHSVEEETQGEEASAADVSHSLSDSSKLSPSMQVTRRRRGEYGRLETRVDDDDEDDEDDIEVKVTRTA